MGDDLHDLGVDALAHFGAAMIDQHRAIDIHMHQRTGLIEVIDIEGNAELDRRQRQAFFQDRAGRVEGVHGAAALVVTAAGFELADQRGDDVVVELLAVRRDVASVLRIKIALADSERILAQRARDVVDGVLDGERTLRSAEATEGGVRLRVGLAAKRAQVDIRQVVRIVDMADRAGRDRAGQVGRITGPQHHLQLHGEDAARGVVTDIVGVAEAVALAGDEHVVVAIGAQLDRALELVGRDCCGGCPQGRLRFLAAEAATHAPAFDVHAVRQYAQCVGHHLLHFGWMLGRTQHPHCALFLRDRVGHLTFQIELFLTADRQRAAGAMRCLRQTCRRIAALQTHRWQHVRLRGMGGFGRQVRGPGGVINLRKPRCAARIVMRIGDHDEQRLADILDQSVGKNRIVMDDRAAVIEAGNVRSDQHGDHAGRGLHGSEIDGRERGMRLLRQAQRGMQRAVEFRDIVDIGGASQHMQRGGLVRMRAADFGPDAG